MNGIIERYKKIRKKGMLEKKFNGKYAFVGIGNHSINNLYPVLDYLNVDLKYIVVRSEETKTLVQNNYSDLTVTTDLKEVLNDGEVKGVFVSAHPSAHFGLAKEILDANKNLFIEKPPCSSTDELAELITTEKSSSAFGLTGLQRRYAPLFNILSKKAKEADYYTLKYKTGGYPEGDELLDLFIHPLDALFYLFGDGKVNSIKVIKGNGTIVYLAQVQHQNGICGSLEFSTAHSWTEAQDILTVHTPKGEYVTDNTTKLTFNNAPKVMMNIPLEKVKGFVPQTTTLYQQNSFLPVKEHNQLYSAGYFNELASFLQLCENGKAENNSPFNALTPTYNAIDALRKAKS